MIFLFIFYELAIKFILDDSIAKIIETGKKNIFFIMFSTPISLKLMTPIFMWSTKISTFIC